MAISKNKNVIITGGSSGIGLSIAKKLAQDGFNIFIVSQNKTRMNMALSQIKVLNKNIDCFGICCDVTNKNATKIILDSFFFYFKSIDVLVNNVSESDLKEDSDFTKINTQFIEKSLNKSLFFLLSFTQGVLKAMQKNKWGRIIAISSAVSQKFTGKTLYTTSKIAQVAFMKSLSIKKEYTSKNITFNCISPGAILTETSKWLKIKKNDPKSFIKINRELPYGVGEPEDIANVVSFLASENSRYVNGINIVVDGGAMNLIKSNL